MPPRDCLLHITEHITDITADFLVDSGTPLQISEQTKQPFWYFLVDQWLDTTIEENLLAWLETDAPWRLVETDFYEQFEFSLFDVTLPASLRSLVSPCQLGQLCKTIENAFQCRLACKIDLVAHKLMPGQHIAIHNDYLVGGETHRFTVQLNRGLNDEDGGFFMLFNSIDASDVHRILRPLSGSAIGFEISPASHHAISRLHGGERYTLVYSFYAVLPNTSS